MTATPSLSTADQQMLTRADAWACAVLDRTGAVARRYFARVQSGDAVPMEIKGDLTPVTEADREIETMLRAALAEAFPEHGIVGEEFGTDRGDARVVWVIDPIDGTKAFATGKPLFGTLLGLAIDGVPIAGWMDCPATGERWVGRPGRPTTRNGTPVQVRARRPLQDAVLYCTSPDMFAAGQPMPEPWVAGFQTLCSSVRWALWNCDCYAYGMLAGGTIDLVVERDLKPHDWCALAPIVHGAGGVMVDLRGRPLRLGQNGLEQSEGDVVAATALELAAAAIEVLG